MRTHTHISMTEVGKNVNKHKNWLNYQRRKNRRKVRKLKAQTTPTIATLTALTTAPTTQTTTTTVNSPLHCTCVASIHTQVDSPAAQHRPMVSNASVFEQLSARNECSKEMLLKADRVSKGISNATPISRRQFLAASATTRFPSTALTKPYAITRRDVSGKKPGFKEPPCMFVINTDIMPDADAFKLRL